MTDVDINYLFLYYCLAKLRILHILSNTAEGEGGREGAKCGSVVYDMAGVVTSLFGKRQHVVTL